MLFAYTYGMPGAPALKIVNGVLEMDPDAKIAGRTEGADSFRGLREMHLRIANLYLGGLEAAAIALFLQLASDDVRSILQREEVQRYITQQHALIAKDMSPIIKRMHNTLADAAAEAVEFDLELMRNMRANQESIKHASLGHQIVKDILDRVGIAAPKKIEVKDTTNPPMTREDLDYIAGVIRENDAIDVTPPKDEE